MNESRRNILQSLISAPAAVAVGLSAPKVVESIDAKKTLLVFRMTRPSPQKTVSDCAAVIREALDGHGMKDIRAILLPEYLDVTVHSIHGGAEKCSG